MRLSSRLSFSVGSNLTNSYRFFTFCRYTPVWSICFNFSFIYWTHLSLSTSFRYIPVELRPGMLDYHCILLLNDGAVLLIYTKFILISPKSNTNQIIHLLIKFSVLEPFGITHHSSDELCVMIINNTYFLIFLILFSPLYETFIPIPHVVLFNN